MHYLWLNQDFKTAHKIVYPYSMQYCSNNSLPQGISSRSWFPPRKYFPCSMRISNLVETQSHKSQWIKILFHKNIRCTQEMDDSACESSSLAIRPQLLHPRLKWGKHRRGGGRSQGCTATRTVRIPRKTTWCNLRRNFSPGRESNRFSLILLRWTLSPVIGFSMEIVLLGSCSIHVHRIEFAPQIFLAWRVLDIYLYVLIHCMLLLAYEWYINLIIVNINIYDLHLKFQLVYEKNKFIWINWKIWFFG